jgi:hypothetical protein
MAYTLPPARVSNAFATGGIGIVTTRTLVAAPGVGFRHRLVSAKVSLDSAATGQVEVLVAGTAFTNPDLFFVMAMMGMQNPHDDAFAPEPGIILPVNQRIGVLDVASVAAQTYFITVYFYTDSIT